MPATLPPPGSLSSHIEQKLFNAAHLRTSQYGFTPYCEQLIRNFITDGVNQMEIEEVLEDNQSVKKAESNLLKLIDTMILEANTIGLTELHEGTFRNAISSLCPLWPFC